VGRRQPAGARLRPTSCRSPMAPAARPAERTHSTIARILAETSLTPAAHLTCVDAPRADVDDVVARYPRFGVRSHRGAAPAIRQRDRRHYTPHPQGYRSSADLVSSIRRRTAISR